jgi:hypothetical protein
LKREEQKSILILNLITNDLINALAVYHVLHFKIGCDNSRFSSISPIIIVAYVSFYKLKLKVYLALVPVTSKYAYYT